MRRLREWMERLRVLVGASARPQPEIEVLGVYRLSVTDELVREQTDILHGEDLTGSARLDAERECRKQLESAVLLEVLVRHADDRFKIDDFTQPAPGVSRDSWQAPWEEAWLTPDGDATLDAPSAGQAGGEEIRVAFYLHCWNAAQPLLSSYGNLACPQPQPMPERLRMLAPYEPLD